MCWTVFMRIKGFLSAVYVKVKRGLHWPWQPFERLDRGVLNDLRLKANTLSLDPLPAQPWQNHISPLCLFKWSIPQSTWPGGGIITLVAFSDFFHWLNFGALNYLRLKANTASKILELNFTPRKARKYPQFWHLSQIKCSKRIVLVNKCWQLYQIRLVYHRYLA